MIVEIIDFRLEIQRRPITDDCPNRSKNKV